MDSAAYTALLMALAGAITAIGAFFKVEVNRRAKQQTDLEAAFQKIRGLSARVARLEVHIGADIAAPTQPERGMG